METKTPWIELFQSDHGWQAVFACQFYPRPFEELQKTRWGFNAAALLGEALDRQKLFIESQYHGHPLDDETASARALALRCTGIPGEGLRLALVGRVNAPSRAESQENAIEYCGELTSTFPIDYTIHPAQNKELFDKLTGKKLLGACLVPQSMAQLLRFETPIRTKNGLIHINGYWQTADRSDEQIWRMLGNYPRPVLLNISLQPTALDNDERQWLWDMTQVSAPSDSISQAHTAQPFDKWTEPLINRRLNPWKRFYLLQVHLLAPAGVTDSLVRPVASAITRESADLLSPGFLTVHPANEAAACEWRTHLETLEITLTHFNTSGLTRLSDIADLNEASAVFRLPYPPEAGLPGVKFINQLE